MKSKKIEPEEVYERVTNYLLEKYKEDAITKYGEVYLLLKRFGLKREMDYEKTLDLLVKKYHKKFNFVILFKPYILLRIWKKFKQKLNEI